MENLRVISTRPKSDSKPLAELGLGETGSYKKCWDLGWGNESKGVKAIWEKSLKKRASEPELEARPPVSYVGTYSLNLFFSHSWSSHPPYFRAPTHVWKLSGTRISPWSLIHIIVFKCGSWCSNSMEMWGWDSRQGAGGGLWTGPWHTGTVMSPPMPQSVESYKSQDSMVFRIILKNREAKGKGEESRGLVFCSVLFGSASFFFIFFFF